jgi:hypothetical protein
MVSNSPWEIPLAEENHGRILLYSKHCPLDQTSHLNFLRNECILALMAFNNLIFYSEYIYIYIFDFADGN